ncbi:hypothetical protein U472_08355 [Orenia metallireducens]|uniref:RHS repeat-associated core domain-containing protein n=1 Tax=Orenia metallireducens TaxID=1413210 RepID=A0A1C0A6Y3_9FIRM|nr:RHS repeat-associated core domain-containing protein [Orenia metallireducens]OCL26025.1 hypothetical protein U472_08355 [Orenia metallireducens]
MSIGLYYYGARYYDPEIGRFTREDTYRGRLDNPQSQNVMNSPLKYIDPSGHIPLLPISWAPAWHLNRNEYNNVIDPDTGERYTRDKLRKLVKIGKATMPAKLYHEMGQGHKGNEKYVLEDGTEIIMDGNEFIINIAPTVVSTGVLLFRKSDVELELELKIIR